MNEELGSLYKSANYSGPEALNATLGVKFSNDIVLLESFLKQRNIPYDQSDLEDTPYGRGYRIKKDSVDSL